ncbi:DUF1995 family protein [Gloeocapsopsis dulcis]|uniref:DUF1995 domain-containing protein n=1 Tax=Gloeocapsopsis dulcis AAB1 = 1H9 TaxID=1433147 RepID=A0A6N8FUQ5_9CHRO|nr:DUF1995 family protein [Gloeocapsopsis dulcis]MUL35877.1 hypothetical protein [Gloeocapsopsis dulcis AAB1 = 1H9]WNN87655.1 DUF1995 family protein [Gloeocapsopsis dulcis]
MAEIPKTLEQAIAQAQGATQAAIADGYSLLQIEIVIPELNPMPVAEQFLPALDSFGNQLKVFFPDAGAAALARRDWGAVPFKILDIGTGRVPVEEQVLPEDEAFLFIAPSAVEVAQVEKLYHAVGERPFILLNPRLEDVSIVGIGYAGRQLRARFLNTIESCYYLRPLDDAALFRCYPSPWQVWLENKDGEYQLIAEQPNKPAGDELDLILSGNSPQQVGDSPIQAKKPGIFASMQRFLRTLSR